MDYLRFAGAQKLALKIENYWANRGLQVKTTVQAMRSLKLAQKTDDTVLFCVRSDMVNGMPQPTVRHANGHSLIIA